MSNTSPKTLNDFCVFIVDCLHKTAPTQDTGYPSIRTPNVGRGRLILTGVNRVSDATYEEWTRRATPQANDLILAREAPAGNVAIIKEGQIVCLGQRTVHLRPNCQKIDPDFLCYYLLAPRQQGALLATETGVTSGHVNMKDIRRLPMTDLPHLDSQRKIGRTIAAYDNLIENNRRRIELLERAARELYREWFVRLRFPGHEHTKITDGLPEGWRVQSISDVAETVGGGTPSTSNPANWDGGDITWVTPTDITRNSCLVLLDSEKKITEAGLKSSSAKLVPPMTILMTSRASVGFFGISPKTVCTNQGFISIMPYDPDFLFYLLQNLIDRVEEIRSNAGGTTYREISKGNFRKLAITMPPKPMVRDFADFALRSFEQVRILHQQNQALMKARDLLLPRLMNGTISI